MALMRTRGERHHRRRGQALVEFALVAPLLLLLMFGIISLGLYINAQVTLQQAARIAARDAAIGLNLGCPGDSLTAGSPNYVSTPTLYAVVDQQIGQGFGMSDTVPGQPNVYRAFLGSTASQYPQVTQPSSTDSQLSYVTVNVYYAYQPVIAIPGILPPTMYLEQSYTMMMQGTAGTLVPSGCSTSSQTQSAS
jgi:Flp pilus assembly protein TadG